MKISIHDVKHIAELSRISLTDKEIETFSSQLNKIIEYVEQLNSLDTKGIEPTSHVIPLNNIMRDDSISTSLSVEEALKNAPDSTGNFYRVPKIID